MKKIAIIGSGGLGREILGIIQSVNKETKDWDFIGFFDDNLSVKLINGYPVIGNIESLNNFKDELAVVIGIGNPQIKKKVRNSLTNSNIYFPILIHPSVVTYSEDTILLHQGVVIGANSVLTVNVKIEEFVYINTAAIISHDTEIGAYSIIMPSVSISTGVKVGKKVYIGNGVIIDKPIIIKNDTVVNAGSVLSE